MQKETDALQSKIKRIHEGSIWFGVIGWASIVIAAIAFIIGIIRIKSWNDPYVFYVSLSPIVYYFYGRLFLMARSAFAAIEELIKERGQIV